MALIAVYFCAAARMAMGIMVPPGPLSLDHQFELRSVEDAKSQLSKLDASLIRMHGKFTEDLAAYKAKLEQHLQKAQEQNAQRKAKNEAMLSKIIATEASNADLREQANKLLDMTSRLQVVMKNVRSNLSIAGEFMDVAINTSVTVQTAPDVQILHELAAKDSEAQQQAAKEAQRLEIERGRPIAMLQRAVDHEDKPDGKHGGKKHHDSNSNFEELMANLAAQWEQVAQAGSTAKASLDAVFEHSLNKTHEEGAVLNQTATELKDRLDADTELNMKLNAAVKSLSDTHHDLENRLRQMQNFAMRLKEMSISEDVRDHPEAEHGRRGKKKNRRDKSLFDWLR